MSIQRLDHLTFKGNLRDTRYGWLRLTPAYSVHLVSGLLDARSSSKDVVLDPFCGTGTTALVCAERGIVCDTTDINPFLLWLTAAKTRAYSPGDIEVFNVATDAVASAIVEDDGAAPWLPKIHQIEKWWSARGARALGRALRAPHGAESASRGKAVDLLKVAFCRMMIERANVSFGHQSMSFKKAEAPPRTSPEEAALVEAWRRHASIVGASATSAIRRPPRPVLCDARRLTEKLPENRYTCVITSPPYPNRMSYIRELRPYMYWLGYLSDGRAAGELDWQAIGGTWGCATSNVAKWRPAPEAVVPFDGFNAILSRIAEKSGVLSNYVHKYFCDMVLHCKDVFDVMRPGGAVHYIVGNSKFYDVVLPVEAIFAQMLTTAGFHDVDVRTIRKRTSKRELFEFVVSAQKGPERGV